MPVYVTVDDPWSRIICFEPNDSGVVLQITNFDHVATDGIFVVVYGRSSAANDRERVLERMFDRD